MASLKPTTLQDYFQTTSAVFNRVAAQFYNSIAKEKNWNDPLIPLALLFDVCRLIGRKIDKPGEAFKSIMTKKELKSLTLVQRYEIIYYVHEIVSGLSTLKAFGDRVNLSELHVLKTLLSGELEAAENTSIDGSSIARKEARASLIPIFNPRIIEQFLEKIEGFFDPSSRKKLRLSIEDGEDVNPKIVFKGAGNRLADSFRQLHDCDLITGCDKKALQSWIKRNYNYMDGTKIKEYTDDYLEKIISRKDRPCKRPLFRIENGQIVPIN